jgi:serine/threonine protein kinase
VLIYEQREPHLAKAYVLKTFHPRRGSEAQWSHEVEAHVALRSTLRQDPGIIWFHHCYTHGKTCNVILELAPFGDLEDLLQKLDPPKTREDIMLFWRSFLRLLETLAYLRDMTYQDQSAYQL